MHLTRKRIFITEMTRGECVKLDTYPCIWNSLSWKFLLDMSSRGGKYFDTVLRPKVNGFESFVYSKKCIFFIFSKIFDFYSSLNRLLLTNCWLKYFRSIWNLLLMFFIFWIMVVSPRLKRYLMVPPQKKAFFLGGVWRLKSNGFGVCIGLK